MLVVGGTSEVREGGREAPMSLLEEELSLGSSDVGAKSECVLCEWCNA